MLPILALYTFCFVLVTPAGVHDFTVPGSAAWFDTKIDLKAGDEVSITAQGKVHFCDHCQPANDAGPGGFPQFPAASGTPGPGLSSLALIARVGGCAPVFVGSGPTIVRGEGRLQFAINDSFLPDNTGAFLVTVAGKRPSLRLLPWISFVLGGLATRMLMEHVRRRRSPPNQKILLDHR